MPIIRIKRGTSTPTISNLTQTGEMAINTNSDEIFIRSTSGIVKVGGGFTLIYSGGGSIPTSLSANNITLNKMLNLYNKLVAFEVRAVTGTDTYETHVVFARLGTNSTVSSSATYDRLYSWTTFDGRYFKTHSFKAYCSNSVSSTMTIGNLKHLIGDFTGSTISWTTNTTTTAYIEKIWLVE